jgi:hypothetical protein
MALADFRRRLLREPLFRMTSDALRHTGALKRFVALRARSDLGMGSAQISRRPHGLRIVIGAPRDPGREHRRRGEHDRDDRFRQRYMAHILQPAEVHGPEHMQNNQDREGNRERSVDGAPPPEYFFLRRQLIQPRIDHVLSYALCNELAALLIERSESQQMDRLSDDPATTTTSAIVAIARTGTIA